MAIYLQPFDRFWCTIAPPLKFRIFENPRWLRLPSWKSQKSRYLRNGNALTDLYEIWYAGAKSDWKPLWPLKNLNLTNPRWRTAYILPKPLKCHLTDFDEIWHDDANLPLTADRPLKFRIYENPRPRKYTTRVDPTSIIPAKFKVDITIHCWVIAFSSAHTSRDLDLWPFDLEQLTYMAGRVTNLATKFKGRLLSIERHQC